MNGEVIKVCTQARASEYQVVVGRDIIRHVGDRVRALTKARRVAVVTNKKVAELYGVRVGASLRESGLEAAEIRIGDGERFKTWRVVEKVLNELAGLKFERDDAVVALGGGVVGDVAGFAAAVYLRGVAFINLPTTLLAQVDASTGGKTGVNAAHGKNLFGAFHHPRLVLVDTLSLPSLHPRDVTAGWCEALKHGIVGNRALFDSTRKFLEDMRRVASTDVRERAPAASPKTALKTFYQNDFAALLNDESKARELARLLAAHINFKADIVMHDEREDTARTDERSRRILNFGHTVAHALEAATNYQLLRHGEAVGYGMLAAADISYRLGLLTAEDLSLVRDAIKLAGELPALGNLDDGKVFEKIAFDKKAVSGSIKWVLIEAPGTPRITDGRDIPHELIRAAIRTALS